MNIATALLIASTGKRTELPEIAWQLDFTIGSNEYHVPLTSIPGYDPSIHQFTLQDFVGVADSDTNWEYIGAEVYVEVVYRGVHESRPLWEPHPVQFWGQEYSWSPKSSYEGKVTYDDYINQIEFSHGSFGTKYYTLVCYTNPVNRLTSPY